MKSCFVHACELMTYSEMLAADGDTTLMNEIQSAGKSSHTETGSWITYDSKLSILEVVDCTSAHNLGVIIFVSTLGVNNVKAKNQDKEGIPNEQKQHTLLKFERSKYFDARARVRKIVHSIRVPEKGISSDPQHLVVGK